LYRRKIKKAREGSSVAELDPDVCGPLGSKSISSRYGSGSESFDHLEANYGSKKNLDSYCFVTSLWLIIIKK
jgi:hypothetical protein